MKILTGVPYQAFETPGDVGLGTEMIVLQVRLSDLNRLQRPGVSGPDNIAAHAVRDGFWLGVKKGTDESEKTLENLKQTLRHCNIRFFPVFKIRNYSTPKPPTGGKIWVSSSKSSYAANFVQLGCIFRDAKTSTFYIFQRVRCNLNFWVKTEDPKVAKKILKILDQEKLFDEAIAEKKKLLREMAKTATKEKDVKAKKPEEAPPDTQISKELQKALKEAEDRKKAEKAKKAAAKKSATKAADKKKKE